MQYQARKRARTLQKQEECNDRRTVSPVRQQQKENLFSQSDVKLDEPMTELKSFERGAESEAKSEESQKLSEKRRSLSESEIHKAANESDNGNKKKTENSSSKQSSIEEESSEHYYPTVVDTQSVEGVVTNVSSTFLLHIFQLQLTNGMFRFRVVYIIMLLSRIDSFCMCGGRI